VADNMTPKQVVTYLLTRAIAGGKFRAKRKGTCKSIPILLTVQRAENRRRMRRKLAFMLSDAELMHRYFNEWVKLGQPNKPEKFADFVYKTLKKEGRI